MPWARAVVARRTRVLACGRRFPLEPEWNRIRPIVESDLPSRKSERTSPPARAGDGPSAGRGRARSPLETRAAGLLLHPTSLPSRHGIGDLGSEARRFADFLGASGLSWWQMLPVGPSGTANSPYQSTSTFAGSTLLLSLDALADEGWLPPGRLEPEQPFREARADYAAARAFKRPHLVEAAVAFWARAGSVERDRFENFRDTNRGWLEDYALFRALSHAHGGASWTEWAPELVARDAAALAAARERLGERFRLELFTQYAFDRQWADLRAHCASAGIRLLGDLPIFVAHDSAEVWAHPELFELDAGGRPTVVAGVPPDYFSDTGQRWGNPVYRWDRIAERGYDWWIERFRAAFARFDALRVDHFIGFQRYWEIPADRETALEGRWMPGPGAALFEAVLARLGRAPIVAEDLGAVTPEVVALRERFGFPGMRVLQFGFSDDEGAALHRPEAYPEQCVAYTGTHDNDTAAGWFAGLGAGRGARSVSQRQSVLDCLGGDGHEIHWDAIAAVWRSRAALAMAPAQDVLGLGSESRMNRPGTVQGNWEWRLRPGAPGQAEAARLRDLSQACRRSAMP